MVIDKKGNILTDTEWKKMSIIELSIDINNTSKLMQHFDELIENFENSEECMRSNLLYNKYLNEIKELLPRDKQDLIMKLEDSNTEMLVLYEEYFYKSGYHDCLKNRSIKNRIFQFLKKHFRG